MVFASCAITWIVKEMILWRHNKYHFERLSFYTYKRYDYITESLNVLT